MSKMIENAALSRRSLFAMAGLAAVAGIAPRAGQAQGADVRQPIGELYAGLQASMRLGSRTPFQQRFDRLAPVIDKVLDPDTILRTSVGLRWHSLDEGA